MPPRTVAKGTSEQPYTTYLASRLSDLMWVAKRNKHRQFMTIFRGQREDRPLVPSVGRIRVAAD